MMVVHKTPTLVLPNLSPNWYVGFGGTKWFCSDPVSLQFGSRPEKVKLCIAKTDDFDHSIPSAIFTTLQYNMTDSLDAWNIEHNLHEDEEIFWWIEEVKE